MNSSNDPLKRLVEAAKNAPSPDEEKPPPTEVGTLRERVRATLLTLTWRRISLLAAIIAGIAFMIFYLIVREEVPGPPAPNSVPEFPETP